MTTGDPLLDATISGLDFINKAMTEAFAAPTVPPDATTKRRRPVQVLDTPDQPFTLTPIPRKLTPQQIAAYLQAGGTKCPDCQSPDISGCQFDVIEGCCWQQITCQGCGATWTDEYELTTVTNFECGVKSDEGGQAIEKSTT